MFFIICIPAPPSPPPAQDQPAPEKRRRRRPRRRRRRKTARPEPPPPFQEEEASRAPAKKTTATDVPPPQVAPTRAAATQTAATSRYVFTEADLVTFLIDYGHLYEQEQWAKMEHCSHEPALSVARRLLRAGEPLSRSLPTARPMTKLPQFPGYNVVDEWVNYEDMDEEDYEVDEDALLLDESRDLTDEELQKLIG